MRKLKISIERANPHVTFISFYSLISLFQLQYFETGDGICENDKKKCGMRDFREKGAGMRDQHPRYQTLFEWSPYPQEDRFYRIRDMAYLKVGFRIPEKNRKRD